MGKPANGGLILALGILSLVGFGFLTGLPAWIMGNNALSDIRSGVSPRDEESLVTAGRVLGMIGTLLSVIGLCFGLVVVMAAAGLASSVPR